MLRLDDQLCFALYAATNAVVRRYRPLLAELGLTYPQYLLLLVLWQDGSRTVGELGGRLSLPPHGLSPPLDRLEAAGLVQRRGQAHDRRVVRVHLTRQGAELEAAAAVVQRSVVCSTGLDHEELAELRDRLHELARRTAAEERPTQTCTPVSA